MADNNNDRAQVRIPPPLYFFACLGFGLLFEYLFPIDSVSISLSLRIFTGAIFSIISGYFALGAIIVMKTNKTPFDPAKSTIKIVQRGPFKFSRNPMYLSLLILLFAIAIFSASFWIFITIPILFLFILSYAVKPEERYLKQKFGKQYLEYAAKVRRWI